ncbi:hypothetical protein GF339_03125 [candidate division KSB3 bacterium]|uniref:AAA+ ATPase domain-containing protein n=1 Tax=candidate division KSB3 bacterium TaxID=2044937 RepID=A0A9D5Q4Q8_9BACT|nr:hypothetical protein [candidate division KSB3 bacterium]MBD3323548.1 hypothetical protein [candidate division KSB3 bacterium]
MNTSLAANLYNPHEQSKEQLIDRFVARHSVFSDLYQTIKAYPMTQVDQHYLIEGQRGMGKTTLLLRLSYEIENDPDLQPWLIPLVFKEEVYYSIHRLYMLWERIAQELEIKQPAAFAGIHERMTALYERTSPRQSSDKDYEYLCFEMLAEALNMHGKKLILFVDNFGELLNNFTPLEYYRLYHILKTSSVLKIVGASPVALEAFTKHRNGFTSLFQGKRLQGLNKEETHDLLLELAKAYQQEDTIRHIMTHQPGRIESLRILTGGVIRTMVLLFEVFTQQEEHDTLTYLNTVLDRVTPLYKSRMDDLTPLQRKIVDTIALNWDAITPGEIARKTRMTLEEVTTVLNELEHVFLIEGVRSTPHQDLYRLKERFFNIWYLMRLSFGGNQAKVVWLLRFLENWYEKTELSQRAQKHIHAVEHGQYQPNAAFYLTEAFVKTGLLDQNLEHQMLQATKKLLQENDAQLAAQTSQSDKDMFKQGEAYYQHNQYSQAISVFLQLKQKNAHIYFRLGYAFSKLQKPRNAVTYFLQAAKEGHVLAMLYLGILYHYHLHDYYNAKRYYTMAVNQGHTDAMLNLANLYYYTLHDYHNAKKYYLMAVKAGQERLRVLKSGTFSLKGLKTYLVKTIKGESLSKPESQQTHDLPDVHQDYVRALTQTTSEAMLHLGHLYTTALKNPEKAERFYRMASEAGHLRAMVALGDLYHNVLREHKKAEKYYYMAAKRRDLTALVNLGMLYHTTFAQPKKAEKCYLLAAQQGDISAMNGLAWLYFEHKRDKQKSLHYAQKVVQTEKNPYTAHTAACIYLWNNQPEPAAQLAQVFLYAPEAYETLKDDILLYLMLLLAKHHYQQVMTYFRSPRLDLEARFKPLHYVLLHFLGDSDYHKLPPELAEPVRDMIHRVNQMAAEYA